MLNRFTGSVDSKTSLLAVVPAQRAETSEERGSDVAFGRGVSRPGVVSEISSHAQAARWQYRNSPPNRSRQRT
jgi:hypothetical protein